MKKIDRRGRQPSVFLTHQGQTLSIKEWAHHTNPENPERAANSIRERLKIRNSRGLTDAQVIFGVTYEPEVESSGDLEDLVRRWVVSAIDKRKDDIACMLIDDLVPVFKNYVMSELKMASIMKATQTDRVPRSGNSVPMEMEPTDGSVASLTDEQVQEQINVFLIENSYPLQYDGANVGEEMAGRWVPGQPLEELYQAVMETLRKYEGQTLQTLPIQSALAPIPVRDYRKPSDHIVIELLEEKEPLPSIPAPYESFFPPLSDDEKLEYNHRPHVSAVLTFGSIGNDNAMQFRTLTNYQDFLKFTHYREALEHRNFRLGTYSFMVQFHQYLAWDLPTRVLLGIVDHRSFNRMMELYAFGIALAMRPTQARIKCPELLEELPKRCQELGFSLLDLSGLISQPPAMASLCREFDRRPKLPLLHSQHKYWGDEYRHALKLLETLSEEEQLWHNYRGRIAGVYQSGDRWLIELGEYDWLPADMGEDERLQMRTIFELICNYGRNKWHWPEQYRQLEAPYPHLVPCDLYTSQHIGIDFSAFDEAPAVEVSTWDWIERQYQLDSPETAHSEEFRDLGTGDDKCSTDLSTSSPESS